MTKLTSSQVEDKLNWIENYKLSSNNANATKVDSNSNVTSRNMATMRAEMLKDIYQQISLKTMQKKIEELYGSELSIEYERQLKDGEIYAHDATAVDFPYCASVSMYPFLTDGLSKIGSESTEPTNISSFCGSYINLIFALSSQFAGAIATVEYIAYFDYFARKEFGEDYLETNEKEIRQFLQGVIYSVNTASGSRGFQAPFTNITIYDEGYFNGMFSNFMFPDGTTMNYETIFKLQEYYINFFTELNEKDTLVFPILTTAMLNDGEKPVDKRFSKMINKALSKGAETFIYTSDKADSLSSCCKLRSELVNNTFSSVSGAGALRTGSVNVITINLNRVVQNGQSVEAETLKICKYQNAYRQILIENQKAGLLPVYDAGFISLEDQFSTIGISGIVESAESMGVNPTDFDKYKEHFKNTIAVINKTSSSFGKEHGFRMNVEQIAGEGANCKFASKDKADGYKVFRDVYSSYNYAPECKNTTLNDKMVLHGKMFTDDYSGGSAFHANVENQLDENQYDKFINTAIYHGVPYFCTNVRKSKCNDCGTIYSTVVDCCEKCKSENIVHGSRVVGYFAWEDSYSDERRGEFVTRHSH